MEYYYFCLVLLFLFFYLLFHEVIQDLKNHCNARYIILYCLLLTLLFKYNYGIEFWGLEYEDAYSFSFCTRQFSHDIYPSSFLIDAISIGSLDHPISMFTYGGHFITYSTFLSIFTQILGWSPQLISTINTFCAFMILLLLSLLGGKNKYWYIAPAIYCVAPIINVFTTCFLSETFSSLLCIAFVYAYHRDKTRINSFLCLLVCGLALLCKRENLALFFIPVIDAFISLIKIQKKNGLLDIVKNIMPYIVIVSIYIGGCQNVFSIESIESNDIGESTFSFDNFRQLLPVFIKSLLSFNTFSLTFYAFLVSILYVILNKKGQNRNQRMSVCMFSIYLILYTFHYRGYFFIKGEEVKDFETYRYINNFYYFIPVFFCTFTINKIKIVYISICLLLVFSFFQTLNLRKEYSALENDIRFEEVEIVSNYIKSHTKRSILICENILLYQNLCHSDFYVCDITQIHKLNLDIATIDYFCLFPDFKYLSQRYGININKNDFKAILQLPNNNYLYIYSPQKNKFN